MAGNGEALRKAVGTQPPQGLVDALDEEHVDTLAQLVTRARASQTRALERAGDDALRHVPWILRKAVEKILL
jgi:hypothetical protein